MVPFGFHQESQSYKDVSEVANGKASGCFCPSCGLPLLARHCQAEREDHFAHFTRGQDKKVGEECRFSFWVSVAAMARQIFVEARETEVRLPDCIMEFDSPSLGAPSTRINCGKESSARLTDIKVDCYCNNVHFDVVGKVRDFEFAIALHYPGCDYAYCISDWGGSSRVGALVIELEGVRTVFKKAGSHFKSHLAKFLFEDTDSKWWLFHPRAALREAEYREGINAALEGQNEPPVPHTPQIQWIERDSRPLSEDDAPRAPRGLIKRQGGAKYFQDDNGNFLFHCRRCVTDDYSKDERMTCSGCGGPMVKVPAVQVQRRDGW